MSITLQLFPGEFAICRLSSAAVVPEWAKSSVFSSVTRTADELSIICPAEQVPADIKQDAGWRLLKFRGPFAFTETGILSAVLAPLANAKVSILAIATFDTDYVLVKSAQLDDVRGPLESAGHSIEG